MNFDAIDDAFHYVSDAQPGQRVALVHRPSGKVYLTSLKAGYDERPEGADTDPDYVNVPHRRELDPGKPLVMEFIQEHCPRELTRVEAMFARPGAFRNVKEFLRRQYLFEHWLIFEEQRIKDLLRNWCASKGLTP